MKILLLSLAILALSIPALASDLSTVQKATVSPVTQLRIYSKTMPSAPAYMTAYGSVNSTSCTLSVKAKDFSSFYLSGKEDKVDGGAVFLISPLETIELTVVRSQRVIETVEPSCREEMENCDQIQTYDQARTTLDLVGTDYNPWTLTCYSGADSQITETGIKGVSVK